MVPWTELVALIRPNASAGKTCTLVVATLIPEPSLTKNKDGQRDPEMHQTMNGNQWHFG